MPPYVPARERFWRFVEVTETCWLWAERSRSAIGYGRFNVAHGKQVTAHRFAYELMVGPVPEGLVLDHLCRIRHCVNPDHLEPVTQAENNRRSECVSAVNARKTHCPAGHAYTTENTYRFGDWRRCRICARAANRASYFRRKEAL